ncbi:hypothetical protein A3C89_01710 [Candidatus Kaiserbacteria bacterium RIFCSPHIGHO2_02_FULL_50_50]|uniref:Uncharacterized protein n=1 Tax=Candidatus Kaiserbacteria bacterium RIFCSPHIGHO2_02_FULL_50_50 TaxID=1798492 RepID=A0A1F6DCI4_9BACT|nr:MAG: hypothetical protein A3C89_01710 [Candidatus Kaiserbacteria bacterium RIFCSPHIGHO2_02_FULL_50_50]OGG88299.1 MAG: hypothetical protein A3G62_03320 [Candidatus Kaiserbacteria bacterium RIFCSPLOWO2_12_FULL_50_10]
MNIFARLIAKRHDTGLQRYTKNLSWMFFARIATMAIGLIATAYIARNLGPTSYGELSYAVSFVMLISVFASLGIDQVISRELILFPEKRGAIMGTAMLMRLASGVFAMILCIVAAYAFSPHDVSLLVIFIISTTLVLSSFTLLSQEFQAQVELKWPSLASIVIVLILNIGKITVIALDGGVLYLAGIIVLEPILYAVSYIYLRTKRFGGLQTLSFDQTIARIIINDAAPLILVSAFFTIYARIDQVFIKHMIDASSVGLYDAAVRLSEVWYFLPHIIATGLFPAIGNAKKTNNLLYWKRTQKLFFFLFVTTLVVATLTTLVARPLVNIVFGVTFAGAAPVLMLYIWSNIGAALTLVTQHVLLLERMTKYILFISFLGMVTNIILCVLLIPSYGMLGAAFGSLVAYVIPFASLFIFPKTRILFVSILRAHTY